MDGWELNLWLDASSLVAGVALKRQVSAGGCFLAATRKQSPTYQPNQTRCCVEMHQFGSSGAG